MLWQHFGLLSSYCKHIAKYWITNCELKYECVGWMDMFDCVYDQPYKCIERLSVSVELRLMRIKQLRFFYLLFFSHLVFVCHYAPHILPVNCVCSSTGSISFVLVYQSGQRQRTGYAWHSGYATSIRFHTFTHLSTMHL